MRKIFILAFLLLIGSLSAVSNFTINTTLIDSGLPILINGSAGFVLNGTTQLVWVTGQPNLTIFYNSSTDYNVQNSTAQVPMDVESGNVSNFSGPTVWRTGGSTGSFFMDSNTSQIDRANYNNLTATGGGCYVVPTGGVGSGVYFNRNCYYSKATPVAMPTGNNPYTVVVWMKTNSTNLPSSNNNWLAWGSAAASQTQQLTGKSPVNGTKQFHQTEYNVDAPEAQNIPITAFSLSNFVYAWNGSDRFSYLNGTNKKTSVRSQGAMNLGTTKMAIGTSERDDQTFGPENETLYHVTFFNSTLNDSVINQTYKNMIGTSGFGDLVAPAGGGAAAAPTVNAVAIYNNTAATGTTFLPSNALLGFANITDDTAVNATWKWYVNGTANATGTFNSFPNNTLTNIANVSGTDTFEGATWVLEVKAIGVGGNTTNNSSTITIDDPVLLISCTNITSAGAYSLLNDVSYAAEATCFNITASNIDLNLGGYRVNKSSAYCKDGGAAELYCAGASINETLNNITIRNGRFHNFTDVMRTWGQAAWTGAGTTSNITISNIEGRTPTGACGTAAESGLAMRGVNGMTITSSNITASCDALYMDDMTNGATKNVNVTFSSFETTAGGAIEYSVSFYSGQGGGANPVSNVSITNSTFYVSGGANACVGLKYANNITFLNNTLRCDVWVTSSAGTLTNIFFNNTAGMGNHYQLKNAREASDKYAIVTTTPPNWATAGTPLPFTSGSPVEWAGTNTGSDYYPWTLNATTPPTITAILVVPSSPTKANTISCNFTATDQERSLLNVTIGEWYKNGTNQTALAFTLNNTANNTATLASNLTPSNFAKGENWSCRIRVYDGTDYSTTNISANVTIGNSLPVNATAGSYSDATAGHWFLMNGSAADLDGGTDITSWNISVATGTYSNVSNSTSGNTRNTQYNYTSTTPASVTPTIGFTDASSAYTQATGAANSYPNQNPTVTAPSVTATLYANSTATCTAGTFSDADGDTEDVSARVFNWRKNGAIVNGTLSTLLLSTVSAVKNDNVSCSQNSTNTTWSGTATNASTNVTVINALPEILYQITFTNSTNSHSFNASAGITDGDGASDIKTTNISVSFGSCSYSSNSTASNNFNVTSNCSSTASGTANISIGFNDSSGSYVQTSQANNGYPNNIPTVLNNITFINATETSSFTANASVQDLDGATDIIATSCQTSSGTCAYVSNSTSANNFTVRYNLTGTGLDSANVNITFNDSFGGTITAPNRTNSYPFQTANGSLVQTLATIGNIVKWQMNYTVNGTGTCTYTIPLSAIQNNTTIVNSTSDAMTNNGNYTDLSWNCNYSADPYLLTFYTENISQSADEAVSYAGIQGSTQNRILLSSAFGQSVNFTFTYTVPADAVSLWLYLCGATTNISCVSGAAWTTQSFSLASSVLNKTLEHTSNETVVIVSYSGSTGAGGGGFYMPPINQTNQTNLTQNETVMPILPALPEGSPLDEYLKIADGYLKDKTLNFPNSLIGIVLLGTSIAYDMRPKKDGKSGASAITLAAGLGIVAILATYGVGI